MVCAVNPACEGTLFFNLNSITPHMNANLIVATPVNTTTATSASGSTQRQTVRIQVPPGGIKLDDGSTLRSGELVIVTTDPTKFSKYAPQQVVTIALP